jgi:3-methylfumaryl-CoA hydratase
MADFDAFIGREETLQDIADPQRMTALAALLDHVDPPWREGTLPPLGHWLCFPPRVRQSAIGIDGHPKRDGTGLIPATDYPRRMWAGSRIRFLNDIPLGVPVTRRSRLKAATPKSGRTGRMLFVTVEHEVRAGNGPVAIREEQDIVYREAATPGATIVRPAVPTEGPSPRARSVVADPVMLFRYSALTFNGHRIHYDRDYSRSQEGYPGLVVQGPFLATLLIDHALRDRPGAMPARFDFRAVSPTFDGEEIVLDVESAGIDARLRAIGPAGLAMQASVAWGGGG